MDKILTNRREALQEDRPLRPKTWETMPDWVAGQ
jgi:hypothetical protein